MISVLYILAKTVQVALTVVYYAMLVRMLLPIFLDVEESRLYALLCLITEPFIIPVRYLFVKFNIAQDSPIDWSFSASCLILILVTSLLPAI